MRTTEEQSQCSGALSQRVLAYCHDSVGIGHLRRTLSICERVGREHPYASFLLATGTPYVALFDPVPRVDCIKLPALTKREDGSYDAKYLGISVERLIRCRESLLLQTAEHFDPGILLVDKAPLGVCRELVPALRWLRRHAPGVRIVFGMRDIEDDPPATMAQWTRDGVQAVIEECFDEIWVYGMRDVFDVVEQYRLSPGIQSRLRFMGYVARGRCAHAAPAATGPNGREVLVTVGGGTDGEQVLDAYLSSAAVRVAALGVHSTVVGGPDLPGPAAQRLRHAAARQPAVRWLDFDACMSCRMQQADLVVSMGGYNTLCELATAGRPALVIPRTHPRLEQTIRATLWEQLGAVRTLPRAELTPTTLAQRVVAMIEHKHEMTAARLDLRGLDRVARRFGEFWQHASANFGGSATSKGEA